MGAERACRLAKCSGVKERRQRGQFATALSASIRRTIASASASEQG
ncbi:hypothetical protein [Planomonospora sphaerica]|nr:hypothetical protein [Planomonospora sphaerica]